MIHFEMDKRAVNLIELPTQPNKRKLNRKPDTTLQWTYSARRRMWTHCLLFTNKLESAPLRTYIDIVLKGWNIIVYYSFIIYYVLCCIAGVCPK